MTWESILHFMENWNTVFGYILGGVLIIVILLAWRFQTEEEFYRFLIRVFKKPLFYMIRSGRKHREKESGKGTGENE